MSNRKKRCYLSCGLLHNNGMFDVRSNEYSFKKRMRTSTMYCLILEVFSHLSKSVASFSGCGEVLSWFCQRFCFFAVLDRFLSSYWFFTVTLIIVKISGSKDLQVKTLDLLCIFKIWCKSKIFFLFDGFANFI